MHSLLLPESVRNIINRLNERGHSAYAVGGCVRDSILGKEPKDFDVTTSALPQEVEEVFTDHRIIETGLQHGTVTVLSHGMPIEITTYRVESDYSDHRHPNSVRFTPNLREDAARRDFTMNALAYHPDEGIIDYFGGIEDMNKKIIRAVGNAEQRFDEDALRILRALRFSSVLGFSIEEQTARGARAKKDLLSFVSAERINAELTKLLCGQNVRSVLTEFYDILSVVLPELSPMAGFDQKNPHHCYDILEHTAAAVEAIPAEPVLRLAALLHDIGKPKTFFTDEQGIGHFYGHAKVSTRLAEDILTRLKYDNNTKKQVLTLVEYHDYPIELTERSVKRALGKFTPELFFALIQLKRADNLAQHPDFRSRQEYYGQLEQLANDILAEEQCFSLKDLTVKGNDLMALGYKGKDIGEMLNTLLEKVMDGDLKNEKEALLEYAKELN